MIETNELIEVLCAGFATAMYNIDRDIVYPDSSQGEVWEQKKGVSAVYTSMVGVLMAFNAKGMLHWCAECTERLQFMMLTTHHYLMHPPSEGEQLPLLDMPSGDQEPFNVEAFITEVFKHNHGDMS